MTEKKFYRFEIPDFTVEAVDECAVLEAFDEYVNSGNLHSSVSWSEED